MRNPYQADKCPVCEAEGNIGWVAATQMSVTCSYSKPFIDPATGVIHHHDGNISQGIGTCTNGHPLWITKYYHCGTPGCDWKGGIDTIKSVSNGAGKKADNG